jgi:hypothetical protein
MDTSADTNISHSGGPERFRKHDPGVVLAGVRRDVRFGESGLLGSAKRRRLYGFFIRPADFPVEA